MTINQATLDKVCQALALIKGNDYSTFDPNEALDLDSINRISLLSELENVFEAEINMDSITPEAFFSLASLVELIDGIK